MDLKLGRRPADPSRPRIRLARSLTGVVPAHPAAADYLARLSGWQMLGNDTYGDCVSVTAANLRRLTTAVLSTEYYWTLPQVEAFYTTQNPGFPRQDDGMDIQTALGDLVRSGGPDGVKALGFASVDHTSPDEVKAAIAIFGAVWTGIVVQDAQMSQFDARQPWDYVSGSPDAGGHSVLVGGYGAGGTGQLGGDEKLITWAQETSFTDRYWSREVEECWVVIWPEHLGSKAFQEGVDLAQFAADYTALTGKPFPVPVPPPPAPVPAPPPVPVPVPPAPSDAADQQLWGATWAWAGERHAGGNKKAAQAVTAWARAKGL
jgi:hypothetical protein